MNPTNHSHIGLISTEMRLDEAQIKSVAQLLEDGATVPFIARYRKEATGSLDEVAVSTIRDRLTQLQELDSRRETILNSLEQHGHLTEDLNAQVQAAETMTHLEDIYLPYRPKRRTKATIAREKGLEPLALAILAQAGADPIALADGYVDPEKTVDSVEAALSGARDIIAETINEDQQARSRVRDLFFEKAVIRSQVVAGKESEGAKYKDYFQWEEPVASGTIPPDPGHAPRREGGHTGTVHCPATGTGHRHIGGSFRNGRRPGCRAGADRGP